ncbi:MAG: hypothetical protein RR448_10375 [Niameybacter sp.]
MDKVQMQQLLEQIRRNEAESNALGTALQGFNTQVAGLIEALNETLDVTALQVTMHQARALTEKVASLESRLKAIETKHADGFCKLTTLIEDKFAWIEAQVEQETMEESIIE